MQSSIGSVPIISGVARPVYDATLCSYDKWYRSCGLHCKYVAACYHKMGIEDPKMLVLSMPDLVTFKEEQGESIVFPADGDIPELMVCCAPCAGCVEGLPTGVRALVCVCLLPALSTRITVPTTICRRRLVGLCGSTMLYTQWALFGPQKPSWHPPPPPFPPQTT